MIQCFLFNLIFIIFMQNVQNQVRRYSDVTFILLLGVFLVIWVYGFVCQSSKRLEG